MINLEELQTMQGRCDKATLGPWAYDNTLFVFTADNDMLAEIRGFGAELSQDDNGKFIAASRTDLPRLIAEVKRLREALQWYVKQGACDHNLDCGERAQEALNGNK